MKARFVSALKARWSGEGGYRQLLAVALPLILANGASSLQQFIDRIFLAWYSPDAMAAATPAGILNIMVMSLFLNTAAYAGTFVAQYYGAGKLERVGPVIWQTVYLSLASGAVMMLFAPLAAPIFHLVGHAPAVARLEIPFFRILCLGSLFPILTAGLSGFYAGQGRTLPVMWVNLEVTGLNVVLDYWLIFGGLGVRPMGIIGAAIATVASSATGTVIMLLLVLARRDRRRFRLHRPRFDFELLRRMVRYGVPSGLQVLLDVTGFTVFVLLVGRLGLQGLAASNIALSVNMLAFMPVIGLGIAVSMIVGRYVGERSIPVAERATYSGLHIGLAYMACIGAAYVLAPEIFIVPYTLNAAPGEYAGIAATARLLLRFVALYSLFDALNLVFSSAVKGAGDTRFVVAVIAALSGGVLVTPTLLIVLVLHWGILSAWTAATCYVMLVGIIFYLRFRSGAWKRMRVIELPVELAAREAAGTGEL